MKRVGLSLLISLVAFAAQSENVDVTVRHAPYVISSVSSKSEHGWAECKYCGSKISYTRTYRWDVYNHVWIETTQEVPTTCRKCKGLDKDKKKLDREEAALDRKIEYEQTKRRIDRKKNTLKRLRQQNR